MHAIRCPADPTAKRSAFSLPRGDGSLCCGAALHADDTDVVGKADLCRVPFLRRHRAAASEAYFVGGIQAVRERTKLTQSGARGGEGTTSH